MNIIRTAATILSALILISGALAVSYKYSQKQSSNIILPGGVTYLGPSPTGEPTVPPTPIPLPKFTVTSDVKWKTQGGKIYPFTFSYPSTLKLVVFPGDTADSVAVSFNDKPPQQNILINMEFIDKRDPKLVTQEKLEYVRNYYKFFSGLKGTQNVEVFTNSAGLKGYRAVYINTVNQTPNTDIFFEVPGDPAKMIHMANGDLETSVFDKIADSMRWKK